MNRSALIALQVVGGLSILPYPFVLLANVMSIAAPGQTRLGALPFLLLSIYPLVWIVLYVVAWRAMSRGATGLAFGLSSVPVAACLVLVAFWAFSWVGYARFNAGQSGEVRNQMEPINPLLWTIWCTGGEIRFPKNGPLVPVEQALQAIEANPSRVNIGVPPYGTPLKIAVTNLAIDLDGSLLHNNQRQQGLIRIVRTLVAKGAHLTADEAADLRIQWMLKLALYDGPITTATENPLVWRILTRKRDGVTLFHLEQNEIPLLNIATSLHGTPLYAALLEDGPDAWTELINAGAHLSPAEEQDPATAAALARVFEHSLDLRTAYRKSK